MKKIIIASLLFLLPSFAFASQLEVTAYCTNASTKSYWGITNTNDYKVEVEYGLSNSKRASTGNIDSDKVKVWIPGKTTQKFYTRYSPIQNTFGVRMTQSLEGDVDSTPIFTKPNTTACDNYFDAGKEVTESPAVGVALDEPLQKQKNDTATETKNAQLRAQIEALTKQVEILMEILKLMNQLPATR